MVVGVSSTPKRIPDLECGDEGDFNQCKQLNCDTAGCGTPQQCYYSMMKQHGCEAALGPGPSLATIADLCRSSLLHLLLSGPVQSPLRLHRPAPLCYALLQGDTFPGRHLWYFIFGGSASTR